MLGGLVTLLAFLGGAALVLRLFRSLTRFTLSAAQAAAAQGLAETGARRGDLTSMNEGFEAARKARGLRRSHLITAIGFLAWLVLPIAFGLVSELYALAAPLWL